MHRLIIVGLILLAIPAYAQEDCGDLNCNGFCFEVADLVYWVNIMSNRCLFNSFEQCTIDNGDVDGDGNPLTVSDFIEYIYAMNDSGAPDLSRHPESDTIMVESASAAPGEILELPIYLETIDTLLAFQFAIQIDSDFITIDSLIILDSLRSSFSYCDGRIYGVGFGEEVGWGDDIFILPGEYHIADLILTVNPDIEVPVTAYAEFVNDPETIRYTGFSNAPFFVPVMVNGEIQITPTDVDNGEFNIVPRDILIDVYPNPFNDNANIIVKSDSRSELIIYDIMGRAVRRFPVEEGLNQIGWDATDNYGINLGSGVFFARISDSSARYSKKIVYLK